MRDRLGYLVLAATAAAYLFVYSTNLGHLPTSFDYLSLLNTTLPLVFVAIGQSLVVIATTVDGAAASSFGMLLVVVALGAACGAVNGLIVARGRIAPILTTL